MSIWNKNEIKREFEELKKDIEVDILIVGAGMTGMTTGYFLKDKNVCIVDANRVGYGVTLNSTAKINYFQERIYTKIASMTDDITAIKYLKSQRDAIKNLTDIIKNENIDCDLKKVDSYVFSKTKKEIEPLRKEILFLKRQGINIINKKLPVQFKYYESYCVRDTYVFNPIKYLESMYKILKSNNINIYENTKIIKIEKYDDHYLCFTTNNHIKAKKVIIACHYPYFTLPFLLPFKSYIEKSYMIVSKVKKDGGYTFISSNSPTYSCRFYKDGEDVYQISLGESHNTAFKQNDEYHFNKVKKMFNLRDKDIVMSYSNVDIMTLDNIPYIGRLKDNIFIGCGYNTWGITNSVVAAKVISDIILNNNNEYAEIFNPNRINISNFIKFPLVVFSQAKSFLGTKIYKNKSWYSNNIKFITKDGKKLAIYKDEKGNKHIIHNSCPHLGCSLIFNEKEKTWDCPCHSSRFDMDGKCIKGPSNYDISYKK